VPRTAECTSCLCKEGVGRSVERKKIELEILMIDLFSVPSFVKIMNDCSNKLKAYETCIAANINNRSKCFDILQDVRKCSMESVNSIKGKQVDRY
jgi:uncharacterized protein with ParB-like and HNH nuclease domain